MLLIKVETSGIISNFESTDPALRSTQSLGLTHQHALNREKQTRTLIDNVLRPNIDIEMNCNEENVNINCSPGFYTHVVKDPVS